MGSGMGGRCDHGTNFNMIWNPALEARPAHICRLYGDNRSAEVKHVVLSPSQQGGGGPTTSSVQSTGG
eukprot:3379715-Karenia_brevis.AAC.1